MRTSNLVPLVKPGSENHPVNTSITGLNLRIKADDYLPTRKQIPRFHWLVKPRVRYPTMGPNKNVDSCSLDGLYKGFHMKILYGLQCIIQHPEPCGVGRHLAV
jgi:hypothetical protein